MSDRTRIIVVVICGLLPWTPLLAALIVGWKTIADFFYVPVVACYVLAISAKPFELVVAKGFKHGWQRLFSYGMAVNFLIAFTVMRWFGFDPFAIGRA